MSQFTNLSSLPSPPPSPRPSRRRAFDPKRIIPQLKRSETMIGCGGLTLEQMLEAREKWADSQDSQITTESSQESVESQN
jgi:hypothetical protein